jgi:hypothetical protein
MKLFDNTAAGSSRYRRHTVPSVPTVPALRAFQTAQGAAVQKFKVQGNAGAFKTFNRCAPFKTFKPGSGSEVKVFEAKKRFGLCVLDYTVTSNHIHLIAHSMQLIAGRPRRK